jgi:hypothetical protein
VRRRGLGGAPAPRPEVDVDEEEAWRESRWKRRRCPLPRSTAVSAPHRVLSRARRRKRSRERIRRERGSDPSSYFPCCFSESVGYRYSAFYTFFTYGVGWVVRRRLRKRRPGQRKSLISVQHMRIRLWQLDGLILAGFSPV